MDYSTVLAHLLSGPRRAARKGWNGKGMWICWMEAFSIPAEYVNGRTARFVKTDRPLQIGGYMVMFTADGLWQPGWLCSQADLSATDWELLPDEPHIIQ